MAQQPIRYFYGAVHEQFSPPQLLAERLEPTVVVLQNISGHDPVQAVRTYGERVLPQLRA